MLPSTICSYTKIQLLGFEFLVRRSGQGREVSVKHSMIFFTTSKVLHALSLLYTGDILEIPYTLFLENKIVTFCYCFHREDVK
jgi:hypothetical protein